MKKHPLFTLIFWVIIGCGKSSNNPTPGSGDGNTSPAPIAATLTFPEENAACTTGTTISSTQSSINFTWNIAENASSYDLTLKNLLTSVTTTQNTTTNNLTLTLATNTPYSWYIISKSTKSATTAQSDTWKFYNSGPGTVTYAPFPADIISPTFGQDLSATGTIKLTWKGSSITNDIVGYDIYFGTSATPSLFKGSVTDSFLDNVAVTAHTLFYWKVITNDALGNSADSGTYQFQVN